MKLKITMAAVVFATIMMMASTDIKASEQWEDIEVKKCWATAYCLTGTTASGTHTTEGRTLAARPCDIGKTAVLFLDDGDGLIKMENLIGTYICEDTGGDTIKKGYVVDVYISDYDRAIEFGAKRVIAILVTN